MSEGQKATSFPRVISRERTALSEWVSLETISVARTGSPEKLDVFHALRQADYVHILAMTSSGSFVLVRQYRPVIESWTLELPGGLRDAEEKPEATAARELREETGFRAVELVPLIECFADVGRLPNRFYGFFGIADPTDEPESGIDLVLLSGQELRAAAAQGQMASANHIALLYLAAIHPGVQKLCGRYGQRPVPWM